MKIAGEFDSADWPNLRTRLEAGDAAAWQEAVNILEKRIGGRYLGHATELLKHPYSGFAVLAIDCAVVEALEQFREGVASTPDRHVGTYFRNFLTRPPFSLSPDEADTFYLTVRNGILHQAETKRDTLVKKNPSDPFVVKATASGDGIHVNASRFHLQLVRAFDDYKGALLNGPSLLRDNFILKMNAVNRTPANPVVVQPALQPPAPPVGGN